MKEALKGILGTELLAVLRHRCRQWRATLGPQPKNLRLPVYLQVGAGARVIPDFLNLDIVPGPGAVRADISRHIPLPNGAVLGIFAEHVLEHLDYKTEVPCFLAECRRVMLPGARIRIVVPDAGAYLNAYPGGGWGKLASMRPLDINHRDMWLGDVYSTRMELINAVFRQGGEHKFGVYAVWCGSRG